MFLGNTFPLPVWWPLRSSIIAFGTNPLGGVMAGRTLSGHDRNPGGGAHAVGVKSLEARSAAGKILHAWCAIEFIE